MGVTSARLLLVGSIQFTFRMNKFVAYSCLAAAVAYGAPEASYGGYGTGIAHGIAAPAIHAPATITKTVTTPKCTVTYETIETQNCIPRTEKECNTEEVDQESVEYERDCKETTSKVCGPSRHIGVIKREASYGGGYGGYGGGIARGAGIYGHGYGAAAAAAAIHAAPVAAVHPAPAVKGQAVAKGTSEVSIKSDCREVTTEICTNTPKKTSKKGPVTTCKNIQKVDCKMITKRIPNKQCEPVEHKVTVPAPRPIVRARIAPAPIARGYGSYGGYGSAAHQW